MVFEDLTLTLLKGDKGVEFFFVLAQSMIIIYYNISPTQKEIIKHQKKALSFNFRAWSINGHAAGMQGFYFLIFVRYRLLAESQWALLVFIQQLQLLFSP